jgi:2'-5' RNA ligase
MRAFISVEISKEITQKLSLLQAELPSSLRPVKPENMHITLKFLGEIDETTGAHVSEVLDSVASQVSPFKLTCRGLGVFPSRKFVRVLWAGIESPELVRLSSNLEPRLKELGFKEEKFVPHLTIARAKDRAQLDGLLEKHGDTLFGECTVDSIHLKKSTLSPGGPIYRVIHSAPVKI